MTGETVGKASAEYRKRRVKRIKRIMVIGFFVLLILPTILSVFLLIKVFSLQEQINVLSANRVDKEKNISSEVAQAKTKTEEPATPEPTGQPVQTPSKPVRKKVYLTFDDGPGMQTEKILDILKKKKVKATFFVTGKEDAYSKKIYRRIVKEGHTLGMHSYSHVYDRIYGSKESFKKDLNRLYEYLRKVTGVYPKYYRFPGGSSVGGTKVPVSELTEVLRQKGISYMDWNVLSPDVRDASVKKKEMVGVIRREVSQYDTSVILFCDAANKPMTVKALPSLIRALQKDNYELLPIDKNTVPIRHNQK